MVVAKNEVVQIDDHTLSVKLTQGYSTLVDNTEEIRDILREHRFHYNNGRAATMIRLPSSSSSRGSRKLIRLCHLILPEVDGGMYIDHIDRDPLNNRISNLRIVSHSVNRINSKLNRNNTSGTPGISRTVSRNYWQAFWYDPPNMMHQKYFGDKRYGGIEASRQAAIDFLCDKKRQIGTYAQAIAVVDSVGIEQ